MRECHLDRCPGGADQLAECRVRAAHHEAGHGLLVCVIAAARSAGGRQTLATLTFGFGGAPDGCLALPEGAADNPWNDALVLLGGPAADAVIHGQDPRRDGADWARSERLLQQTRVRLEPADAFAATVEVVEYHRGVVEVVADALLARGMVLGTEVWKAFAASRADRGAAAACGAGAL